MEVSVEKPGTPADVLEHYGKKGMKWGVRSAQEQGRAANRAVSREFHQQNPTSAAKAQAIYRARARSHVAFTKYTTERDPLKREQLKRVYLSHPDRATALRTTRGEKAVFSVLAVGTPAATTAIAGPPGAVVGGAYTVGLGAGLAGRMAFRRYIERKQARGGYG